MPPDEAGFGGVGDRILVSDEGNDVLLTRGGFRDRVIDCGPGGADRVVVDRRDGKPHRCKQVLEPKDRKKKRRG